MAEKDTQKRMDRELENSFPASDPPSWSTPRPEAELELKKTQSKGRPDQVQKFDKTDYLPDPEHGCGCGHKH